MRADLSTNPIQQLFSKTISTTNEAVVIQTARNREMQQFSQYAWWRLQNSMPLSYCFQIRTK